MGALHAYSRVALNWPFSLVAELDFHFSNPVSLYWPLTLLAEWPRNGQNNNWNSGRTAAKKENDKLAEWPRSGQKIEIQSHFTGLSFYWPPGKNIRNFTLVAGQLSATRL